TRSGTLTVRRETREAEGRDAKGSDLYVMDFPARPATPARELAEAVAAMLRARPVEVLRGPSLVATLETADDVRRLQPDFAAIAREGHALCVTAPADAELPGVDFVSRYFAPAHGIPEDPVTGSSYTTLAPYWAARLGKPALRARQVSARGGDVRCEDRGERVLIAGQATLVIKGALTY
ncbi:MAG TPA: PhzF family phenazine biosynthesis protein, partial [Polyangia bacterium]|nr:PhzF family phenazine biosynthesis protein [Polyangia bacterium]